jgi:hypothetical protein
MIRARRCVRMHDGAIVANLAANLAAKLIDEPLLEARAS